MAKLNVVSDSSRTDKLRVLFFSQRFPLPMDTGGKIRTGKMLQKLKDSFDVTLVCNVEHPKDDPYLSEVKTLCSEFHEVPWREIPKYTWRFYLRVLVGMLSPYPITVRNDYSPQLENKIRELVGAKPFDLLICDFLQPTLNFRHVMQYPTLLFQHNVETMIAKRHYHAARHPLMKILWRQQWRKMERFEREMSRRFRTVVAVSEQDKAIFEREFGLTNVHAIPTGVDLEYYRPYDDSPEPNTLVYVGAMDWLPNEDGILYFAEEIFPRIQTQIPSVTLTVVGRNPSQALRKRLEACPGIRLTGRVDDVRPYIAKHAVYVIPLRIGGGTRIKVYEAMAMGKPVVSTSIGAEGLPVRHGEHLLLADDPHDFARCVIELLRSPVRAGTLGRNARAYVEAHCGWDHAVKRFAEICRQTVESPALSYTG
ncbi:MAG: glycosyltransferase [Nitrospirae bacterium]|nr:MAG: glycosyltransferase [Nitrospirota bacterium]